MTWTAAGDPQQAVGLLQSSRSTNRVNRRRRRAARKGEQPGTFNHWITSSRSESRGSESRGFAQTRFSFQPPRPL